MTSFFISYQYTIQKEFLYKSVDDKLSNAAYSGAFLLGDKLNNLPFDKKLVSRSKNIKNALLLSTLTDKNDVIFVYTLRKVDQDVYFSCSSVTQEQKKIDGYLPYLLKYEDATNRLKESFDTHKAYYGEVTDKYGTFRSIIMPRVTKNGTWYIIGADIKISNIDKQLNSMLTQYLIAFILFIIVLLLFIKIFNRIIQKENDDKLNQQKLILEQSKLAQMGEMIGNISHQWRQPLSEINSIMMNIESDFKNKKLDRNSLDGSILEVENLTEHMSITIDNFNNYLKKDKHKEEFLVSTIVKKGLELTKNSMLKHNINIELNVINDKLINSVEGEFIQVIIALLQNAKDVMLLNDIKNKNINIIVENIDDKINITILDNGGGVANDIKNKIFEPYFTTKFKSTGIGIGLYMSKMIIEKNMNGKLEVHNKENGAEFKIIL